MTITIVPGRKIRFIPENLSENITAHELLSFAGRGICTCFVFICSQLKIRTELSGNVFVQILNATHNFMSRSACNSFIKREESGLTVSDKFTQGGFQQKFSIFSSLRSRISLHSLHLFLTLNYLLFSFMRCKTHGNVFTQIFTNKANFTTRNN